MAKAMVSTGSPKARAKPTNPIPRPGNAAASTALPQPPKTNQKVPRNSARDRFVRVIRHSSYRNRISQMGFALWIDESTRLAWAQGTHEYRAMGTAVIAWKDQFRHRDSQQLRRRPAHLENSFAGFFGSLAEVNAR